MKNMLLTKAEKTPQDFKYYYPIVMVLSVILWIVGFIETDKSDSGYLGALMFGGIPIAICTLLFTICMREYIIVATKRKYLYKYGLPIEGTVKNIKRGSNHGQRSYRVYYMIVTYEYCGKKRRWKSPHYEEPLGAWFNIGGPCRLHIKTGWCVWMKSSRPANGTGARSWRGVSVMNAWCMKKI